MNGRIAYFVLLSSLVLATIIAILYIQQEAPSYHRLYNTSLPEDIPIDSNVVLKQNLIYTACYNIHWSLLSAIVFIVIMYIFLFFKA
jgi:Cu/Ag efflux pump CusA